MLVVHERDGLLHVCVLVRDDVHEAVLDVRIHPFGRAKRLETDLQTRDRTAHANGLAATDDDRDRRRSGLRVQAHELRVALYRLAAARQATPPCTGARSA